MEKNEAIEVLQEIKDSNPIRFCFDYGSERQKRDKRLEALQLAIDALKGKSTHESGKQTQSDYLRTASPEQVAAGLGAVIVAIMQSDASLAVQSIEGEIYDWLMSERKG
jgi:hypothetical protein